MDFGLLISSGNITRSVSTGKIIDNCIVDAVPEEIRSRYLNRPDDLRMELIMKGALQLINGRRADLAEVYFEPRTAQEAAIRNYGSERLVPGWSLDLAREDSLT